jgi:threonine dehydrogenase-like Zn-dependent dehydrogenase
MRADKCLISGGSIDLVPIADMRSTPVFSPLGGFAELMIVHEEQAVPVFTSVAADELAQLNCVSNCGLATTMTLAPVDVASDVVVFGAGPVGLSAIQGARIKGASQIIVVEPIRYRRELALKLGATTALDPNVEGQNLVKHIQELCTSKIAKTDRRWAGGGNIGPDHIIEAVGGDRLPPKTEKGPDPTGVQVLQQCSHGRESANSGVSMGRRSKAPSARHHGRLQPAARFAEVHQADRDRTVRHEVDLDGHVSPRSSQGRVSGGCRSHYRFGVGGVPRLMPPAARVHGWSKLNR